MPPQSPTGLPNTACSKSNQALVTSVLVCAGVIISAHVDPANQQVRGCCRTLDLKKSAGATWIVSCHEECCMPTPHAAPRTCMQRKSTQVPTWQLPACLLLVRQVNTDSLQRCHAAKTKPAAISHQPANAARVGPGAIISPNQPQNHNRCMLLAVTPLPYVNYQPPYSWVCAALLCLALQAGISSKQEPSRQQAQL